MSKQRSSTPTSGRGSQASTTRASSSRTAQDQEFGAGQSTGAQGAGSFTTPDVQARAEQSTMEKAQQLAGQVQQKATQRVESRLTRGKTQAAQTLNTLADSLISTGQQLRERNQEPVSRYIDQAADNVQRFSNYLQNTEINEIVDRAEAFARRRPALFLGGAFALGLLGARFLKSSKRGLEGRAQWSGSSGVSGQRRVREGFTGSDVEVPTSQRQQEWAAGGVGVSGLADLPERSTQTRPLGVSGFSRETGELDLGKVSGGPEASQR